MKLVYLRISFVGRYWNESKMVSLKPYCATPECVLTGMNIKSAQGG